MRKITLFILFGIICSSLQVHSQNNTVPGFKLVWQKASAETGAIANKLYYSEVFTHVVNGLNAMFALPQDVYIVFTSSDEGAYYSSETGYPVVTIPYETAADDREILDAGGYGDSDEELDEILYEELEFTLYHEVGHALIEVLQLPTVGRQEDVVDEFALYVCMRLGYTNTIYSAALMYDAFSYDRDDAIEDNDLMDGHSLDLQRKYRLLCLLYGSDAENNGYLLDEMDLDEEQMDTCVYDFEDLMKNWYRILYRYLRQ
ncbi:MAG: hypothetical protein H6570_17645 [Lewinellaceae bacterium]|nr:hypothetical protein [Lewinellaceae bacterium]